MDSQYIQNLKAEHENIKELLHETARKGVATPEGIEELEKLKKAFYEHKNNEDEYLMAKIEKANNSEEFFLSDTILENKKEHIQLEESIEKFFEMLKNPQISEKTKNEEFGKFMAQFTLHMNKEEHTLYKEYDKIP